MSQKSQSLSELQHWLCEQLVQPRDLHKDPLAVERAALELTGNDRLLPVDQLEIYREQFWLRHTGSLLEDFPGLSGILGQQDWNTLSVSYLQRYPCKSFTLRDLGMHMPEHVQQCPQLPHPQLCLDMARLEWAYVEIFDAPERTALDGAKLASLSEEQWQRARLIISPAVRLLQVQYPVAALRQALREAGSDTTVAIPAAEQQNLLLFRDAQRNLRHRALEPLAFAFLQRLQAGDTLIAAGEGVAQDPSAQATLEEQVFQWFAEWARLGVICDVEV